MSPLFPPSKRYVPAPGFVPTNATVYWTRKTQKIIELPNIVYLGARRQSEQLHRVAAIQWEIHHLLLIYDLSDDVAVRFHHRCAS